jgi:hypothetical protein
MTDGKPSDIVPEHPSFTLVGYPRLQNMRPEIRVFSVAEFRKAVAVASKKDAKNVVYPPNPLTGRPTSMKKCEC